MKKHALYLSMGLTALVAFNNTYAQNKETIKRKGYTLVFTSNDNSFNPKVKQKLIETFFEVYPKIAKEYNNKTLKEVTFVIDTAYKGVAATSNGRIVYNPGWFKTHPEDIDVVTHEGMHIVQDYKQSVGPGWLTEGIADYVRYKFGVNNSAANWKLPEYKSTQHYTNSYRITARFLNWIEQKQKEGVVKELDKQLRNHSYNADSWKQLTGKSLDELWTLYSANPMI
ncbi:basic secretory protein-like protein [uncultured Mucilaginibacter sp.]|uniref:basic secretory protein-like protein n=1 Tax=uncultured Mucilaginibacter sp. TaxID=797541 RepID=UPI0025F7990C|nr:basic secretory protein-like protein [uncultured Mucilaginibacter sp.]